MQLTGILGDFGPTAAPLELELELIQSRYQASIQDAAAQLARASDQSPKPPNIRKTIQALIAKMILDLVERAARSRLDVSPHPRSFKLQAEVLLTRSVAYGISEWDRAVGGPEADPAARKELEDSLRSQLRTLMARLEKEAWDHHARKVKLRLDSRTASAGAETQSEPRTQADLKAEREGQLKTFLEAQSSQLGRKVWIADVGRAARVHRPNMAEWNKGILKEDSVMSQRIQKVLSGEAPLIDRKTSKFRY